MTGRGNTPGKRTPFVRSGPETDSHICAHNVGGRTPNIIPITAKLFASLRKLVACGQAGEIDLKVEDGSSVEGVVFALAIPKDRVRMIMINGTIAAFDDRVNDGDRVALFPPEVAFNLYVALNYREDLRRKK